MAVTGRPLIAAAVTAILLSAIAAAAPTQPILAADFWSISIPATVGVDGGNPNLTFGTKAGASDGFDDGGTDVPAAPSAPGGSLDAYFEIADAIFSRLYGDYRQALGVAPGSSITWTLRIDSTSQPIQLVWPDPATVGFPSDASLILTGGGQTIDMRTISSATFASGAHTLTITATRSGIPVVTPDDDDDSNVDGDGGASSDVPSTPDGADDEGNDDIDSAADGTSGDGAPSANGTNGGAVNGAVLNIAPSQALPDHAVAISANICNNGNESSTRTVSLIIDGVTEQTQTISLSGGACQQVTFTTSRTIPGTYQVAIDGMAGQFSVLAPETVTGNVPAPQQTGLGTTGIIAVVAVMALLITAIIVVFRKT